MNPWVWLCRAMLWYCTRRTRYWFRSGHPYWDCKAGKAHPWSVKKYGPRPQDVFYRKWDDRRILWLNRLGESRPTFEQLERQSVRDKYGW